MLKISEREINALLIPDRVDAEEVAVKLRLPMTGNILSEIDLDLTPYIRTPLSLIGDPRVEWIFIIAPTQSGKTVFLQTALADAIIQDPGNCLYLLPDETSGRKHMKSKIIDVITETPELSAHTTGKVRDISKQGIQLDHMTIFPGWSGSLATISSFPMKRVFLDEVRLMKLAIGAESNAIQLAEDRLTTYLEYGIGQGYGVSSPSVEGDLLHQQLDVANTSVWFWQVQCPVCERTQPLNFFKNLKHSKGKVWCQCLYCNGVFDDADKKKAFNSTGMYVRRIMKEDGKWHDTAVSVDGIAEYPFKVTKRMVFWWNSMVSPFRSFIRIWNKYLETKDKLHDYKNFIQCWNATFWVDDVSKTSAMKLKERCKPYNKNDVPSNVKVICAGIDTQDDGFYVVIRGFGSGRFTCLIDEFFIPCPMQSASIEDINKSFTSSIFERVFIGTKKWRIALCAIDTGGHRTKEIYQVAQRRLILVKGQNTQNIRIKYNKELNLYLVRTYEYLDETEDLSDKDVFNLPDNIDNDYLTQFCNIRKVREVNKKTGEEKIIWKKVGKCDYRMADVHAFICLDIPTQYGILRQEIDKDDFELTAYAEPKVRKINLNTSATNSDDYGNDFINAGKDWI